MAEHQTEWRQMSKKELIAEAENIVGIKSAYHYLTAEFEAYPEAANFFLHLSDPLQEVANAWLDRNWDWSDIGYVVEDLLKTEQIMRSEAKFRALDFAEDGIQQEKKPSVLAMLKSSVSALVEPKAKAAAKNRGEER